MTCLVFRHRQAYSVDGIGDACVLQTVELVMCREVQSFTNLYPPFTEDTPVRSLLAWLKIAPEQIEAVGVAEHVEVKHHLYHPFGDGYYCVLPVLAELVADEKRLVTDSDVPDTDVGQFVGAYQGVVVHQTGEQIMLVVLG